MWLAANVLVFLALLSGQLTLSQHYEPDWKSLDSRPLPDWYDDAKFGIFSHFGVYSVPSFGSEWFWFNWKGRKIEKYIEYMKENYKPDFTYADFAPQFTAEFFEPDEFAKLIELSGAKYFILTSKHHEGFTNWPSNYSFNWNSMDVGPNRDIVGELAQAIRKTSVRFGLYYSLFEWFHPLFLKDKKDHFKTQLYQQTVMWPQLMEIVNNYQPEVIWSDGQGGADSESYWNSTGFLAWLYNESPVKDTVVVNDRWGKGCECKHGGYFTCHDRYSPGVLQAHKWENCMTVDKKSWGFRREMKMKDVLSLHDILIQLAKTVSCGGNLLLNVGPTQEGRIVPVFEERLTDIGAWLKVNGEAIYGSKPWIYQNDTYTGDVWYTSQLKNNTGFDRKRTFNTQIRDNTIVYAIVLDWPKQHKLQLGAPKSGAYTKVSMLGYPGSLPYLQTDIGLLVDLSEIDWTQLSSTVAWVLKLERLQDDPRVPKAFKPFPQLTVDLLA